MSEDQFVALWMMLVIGMPGVLVAIDSCASKRVRVAGGVWVALWWLPPLAMLWVKGVFG